MVEARPRILGVDFSGARDAERRIWIAQGLARADGLTIEALDPLRALASEARGPRAAARALGRMIAESGPAVVGVDAPFSVPAALSGGRCWTDYVAAFERAFPTPHAFRTHCQAHTDGEVKRATDKDARTPFAVYNLRLFRQTYHAICDVAGPLIAHDVARFPPMQNSAAGLPTVLETCPASLLQALRWRTVYKGRSEAASAGRRNLIRRMRMQGVSAAESIWAKAQDNAGGDALDALLCALTCRRIFERPEILEQSSDVQTKFEGKVFL